jgi:hypothetical protein
VSLGIFCRYINYISHFSVTLLLLFILTFSKLLVINFTSQSVAAKDEYRFHRLSSVEGRYGSTQCAVQTPHCVCLLNRHEKK